VTSFLINITRSQLLSLAVIDEDEGGVEELSRESDEEFLRLIFKILGFMF